MSSPFSKVAKLRAGSLRRALGAAAIGLAALSMSAPPASAGFLDFLFKPARPAPAAPYGALVAPTLRFDAPPAPGADTRHAHTAPRRARVEQAEPGKPKANPCCKPGEDPVAYLMNDPTLQPGDAVMTRDGIRIFVGRVSSHHSPSDFVSLSQARNVAPAKRALLVQVDVRPGEPLPVVQALAEGHGKPKAVAQHPHKPKVVAQRSHEISRLALADR